MSDTNYKWGELVTEVKEMLTADGNIRGGSGLVDRAIQAGAANLQRFIPTFKRNLTKTFAHTLCETYGACSIVPLPPHVRAKKWFILPTPLNTEEDYSDRRGITVVDWDDRYGLAEQSGCPLEGGIAVNEDRTEAWVYPQLSENYMLVMHYEGDRLKWTDEEPTRFPRDILVVEALYYKAKAAILRDFENDPAGALFFDREPTLNNPAMGLFQERRRDLWSEYAKGLAVK